MGQPVAMVAQKAPQWLPLKCLIGMCELRDQALLFELHNR
jgi:hypothetical protein